MNGLPNHIRLLVVDDEELQRDIISAQLGAMGLTDILTAVNGADALQIFDSSDLHIDVVLCDLSMPDMDGLVLMRNLAQRKAPPAVILVSGSDEEILRSAEGLGHAHGLSLLGVLTKPCDPHRLAELMQSYRPPDRVRRSDGDRGPLTRAELISALQDSEFIPWYQPKLDLLSGKAIGVEALARWNRADTLSIGPGQFVPAMEAEGLVDELFFQIADRAATQLAEWRSMGIQCTTAINLSMDTARRLDLPEHLEKLVFDKGLQNADFVIEVTESRLAVDRSLTMETLTRLSLMGFTLSIDDFGTGYSSLVQLIDLPFRELKIDGSFVRRADTERKAQTVLQIALMLGTHLQMKVVAEGVETAEQLEHLKLWGADAVQGYCIAKPMPFDACTEWLMLHGNTNT